MQRGPKAAQPRPASGKQSSGAMSPFSRGADRRLRPATVKTRRFRLVRATCVLAFMGS
jgi:hypothetical protein